MLEVAPGWPMDVERGPDWLFVRLHPEAAHPSDASGLAETLWNLLQQQFAHRLVLELDDVPYLSSSLIGELVRLSKRVQSTGGLMRLCGLSDRNLRVLHVTHLSGCFPHYRTRTEAVMTANANKPR